MYIFLLIFESVCLGVGLAMDAFSVSLANGCNNSRMSKSAMCCIAGTFGGFQGAMPLIGWVCVHTLVSYFKVLQKFIPYIALVLLLYIGIKMLIEGISTKETEEKSASNEKLKLTILLMQGVATSIDALSVGFTIEKYGFAEAFSCAVIIALVTFFICLLGLYLGKKIGVKLSGKANILGGIILVLIGIEIFVKGVFF